MLKIKKISLFFIFCMSFMALVGCGIFGGKPIDEDYFENYEKITEEKEKVYNNFNQKITDDAQKTAFSIDYVVVGSADLLAGMYIAVVNLYNVTPNLVSQSIEKSSDTYTITEGDSKVIVRYDKSTKSTQLEIYDKDVLEYVLETTELSNGGYAYQLYSVNEEEKSVYQFYFKVGNGSLSVKENVSSRPDSIYKKSSVSSTFATTGDRVYKLDAGTYTFDGTLGNQKTITGFVIHSGLDSQYLVNGTLNITNLIIKVTYSDNTTQNVNVTQTMLSSSMPDMTTVGSKTFKLTYEGVEKTFTVNVVSKLKAVTEFTVKSGLKTSYKVNETFDVTNISLEVKYDDNSKETLFVTTAMIVGNVPTTASTGEKQLVLKLGTIQKTITFNVTSEGLSAEDKINNSYGNFFSTLDIDENTTFTSTYLLNFSTKGDILRNNFFNDFTDDALGQWGAVTLGYQAVEAIYLSQGKDFATVYPTPTNSFNKNNYLNFTDGKYNLGLWITKGLSSYWFEFVIEYNETNDAFKMSVKSGVGQYQVNRATFEYVGYDDGKYAMNLYYYDESYDPADYCVYQLLFTNNTGSIVKNYLVNQVPASIYSQSDFTNFGKTGDDYFNMTSITSATYTKNIKSDAYNLYASVAYILKGGIYENIGSLEDVVFKKIENLDPESEFDRDNFSLDHYKIAYAIEVLRAYEEKEFRTNYDGYVVVVTKSGATTTLTLTDEYDNVDTIKVTFTANKVKVEFINPDERYIGEVVKVNNEYYIQIVEKDSYNDYYVVSKGKYTDTNNAVFLYSDAEESQPVSIYTSIPTNFTTKGNEKFELKNGNLTFSEAFEIYVDPSNETDSYTLYTDFSGKLVLPSVTYPGYTFEGWYLDDVYIGMANVTYTFTEDSSIYALFE